MNPGQNREQNMEVSRDRVETLWRQALNQRSSSRSDLSAARDNRSKAEVERQRIAKDALEATRQACRDLITEAERQASWAKQTEGEARERLTGAERETMQAQMARAEADSYHDMVRSEADTYRDMARSEADKYNEMVRSEAESYRDKVMAEAHEESQRIREEARSAALQECEELKRHVTYEVECILSEIDTIREAAQEELEAQRIYAEAATIRAMSQDVHSQVTANPDRALGDGNGSSQHDFPMESTITQWETMGVGEHHDPEHVEEPMEMAADVNDRDGASAEQVSDTGRRSSKNGKGSSRSTS